MKPCSCRQSLELLMDYVEGRLQGAERAELDRHFADCPPCLDFLASYKEVPKLARKATACQMPRAVAERLASFLHLRCSKTKGD